MQTLEYHNITKIILKKSFRFFCNNCNTSYPTLKSVLGDHPKMDINEIKSFKKMNGYPAKDNSQTHDYTSNPQRNNIQRNDTQ